MQVLNEEGDYDDISANNVIIEMLSNNGFDIPLLELPIYSDDQIAQMFNL